MSCPLKVLDVRKSRDRVKVLHPVAGAEWRDPDRVHEWAGGVDGAAQVIVFCVHGQQVCRSVRDALTARGRLTRILEGGIEAWCRHQVDKLDAAS